MIASLARSNRPTSAAREASVRASRPIASATRSIGTRRGVAAARDDSAPFSSAAWRSVSASRCRSRANRAASAKAASTVAASAASPGPRATVPLASSASRAIAGTAAIAAAAPRNTPTRIAVGP